MTAAVTLRNVTIRYRSVTAVESVDADFPRGAVGLLGRNGAGKTSILKALLGLVVPTVGELRIADVPPGASKLEIRRYVGYMPERDCFVPGLNGFETVRLAAELSGLPGREASRRAHEVLWLVDLGEHRYRAVSGYSVGMRQKVKLATALVHDPAILFLDEPTNGLDPDGRREMLELIDALAIGLGKSVVLSSHILPDVERVCHDVVVLERGKVVAAGSVADLTRARTRVFEIDAPGPGVAEALRAIGALDVEAHRRGGWRVTLPERPSRSGPPGASAATLDLGTKDLFAAVARAGAVVQRLVEVRRSLSEVFLGAVGGEGGAATDSAERGR